MAIELVIQDVSACPDKPEAAELQGWADTACADLNGTMELLVRIVDEAESQALNLEYRGKDRPTNVLSFPFEVPPGIPADLLEPQLGDLVICAPVVVREAKDQGKSLQAHWAHILIHGVLHLRGHDHIQEAEAEAMEALEVRMLADLGFADPYGDAE
jgi:probable rRNA maturation factor